MTKAEINSEVRRLRRLIRKLSPRERKLPVRTVDQVVICTGAIVMMLRCVADSAPKLGRKS